MSDGPFSKTNSNKEANSSAAAPEHNFMAKSEAYASCWFSSDEFGFFFPSKKHYQRLTAAFLDMHDTLVTDQAGTHVAACMRGPRAS